MGEARNKIIDGWRGLSVALVVIGHVVGYRFVEHWDIRPLHEVLGFPRLLLENIAFRIAADLGETGVQFFFVISGFLITRLLCDEEDTTQKVSIGAFYVRRIFRIMPAFYIYLIAILVLRNSGLLIAKADAFIRSALYVCNLSEFKCSWWLAHTWSLGVEEQFYLVWPLTFVLLGRRRELATLGILIALVIGSYWLPALTSFANIAIGALVATSAKTRNFIAQHSTTFLVLFAAAVLALKPTTYPFPRLASLIQVSAPFLTGFVFFGTLNKRGGLIFKIVASSTLQKIGLISYSVYLWQQLSFAPYSWGGSHTGAQQLYASYPGLLLLAFFPIAVLSYVLIERPFIKLGHKISSGIKQNHSTGQPSLLENR